MGRYSGVMLPPSGFEYECDSRPIVTYSTFKATGFQMYSTP